jgi:hypothetical protein
MGGCCSTPETSSSNNSTVRSSRSSSNGNSISGHRPPTNYGSTDEQQPSIEEAIDGLDRSKESQENKLEGLKQQLRETR